MEVDDYNDVTFGKSQMQRAKNKYQLNRDQMNKAATDKAEMSV